MACPGSGSSLVTGAAVRESVNSLVTGAVVCESVNEIGCPAGGGSSFGDGSDEVYNSDPRPPPQSAGNDDDNGSLLAARREKRRTDRMERRRKYREKKGEIHRGGGGGQKEIKDIGEGEDAGPLVGPLPLRPEAVLRRSFATAKPPGMGRAHDPLGGVQSLERPFTRAAERDPDAPAPTEAESTASAEEEDASLGTASTLPAWVRNHRDFGRCVARPLDPHDAGRRAAQLRKSLRAAPEDRPLSAVLEIATWLAEYTDLSLSGVRRRNLMTLARAMTMRRVKRRGKAVYSAGDPPAYLYIVIEGEAVTDVTVPPPKPPVPRGRAVPELQVQREAEGGAGVGGRDGGGGGGGGLGVLGASSTISSSGSQLGCQSTMKPPLRPLTPPALCGSGVGHRLGPGRSFGFVSPMTAEEPRAESVYAGTYPHLAPAEQAAFERREAEAAAALAAWENADLTLASVTVATGAAGGRPAPAPRRPPHLLLAALPLDLYYEECAPGLSRQADSFKPFIAEHVRPARQWPESKAFVFARSLAQRTFMPGDVVR